MNFDCGQVEPKRGQVGREGAWDGSAMVLHVFKGRMCVGVGGLKSVMVFFRWGLKFVMVFLWGLYGSTRF